MMLFKLRPREYQDLEALTKQCHEAVVVRRAHALLGLHEGIPAAEIAELLDVSRQTVYNWAQSFQNRKNASLMDRLLDAPRTGRPAIALGIIDPLLDDVIDQDPRDH